MVENSIRIGLYGGDSQKLLNQRGIDHEIGNLKKLIEELRSVTGELMDKLQPVSLGDVVPREANGEPCENTERSYIGAEIKSCADFVDNVVKDLKYMSKRLDM